MWDTLPTAGAPVSIFQSFTLTCNI
uniref:Uncharacterized protein n=1 Tax=Anguilla anguilla TaxID=7936 RepID=A0A0E9W2S4_ANGAN